MLTQLMITEILKRKNEIRTGVGGGTRLNHGVLLVVIGGGLLPLAHAAHGVEQEEEKLQVDASVRVLIDFACEKGTYASATRTPEGVSSNLPVTPDLVTHGSPRAAACLRSKPLLEEHQQH